MANDNVPGNNYEAGQQQDFPFRPLSLLAPLPLSSSSLSCAHILGPRFPVRHGGLKSIFEDTLETADIFLNGNSTPQLPTKRERIVGKGEGRKELMIYQEVLGKNYEIKRDTSTGSTNRSLEH